MKAIPHYLALMIVTVWLVGGAASAQVPLYTANTTIAVPQTGAVHFLQILSPAQGPGTYKVDSFTFSANFTTGAAQTVLVYVYSGVDTSPTSTNALAHATLLSAQRGDLLPPGPGNYAFTYSPPDFTFTTDSAGSIGVEFFLLTADVSAFSTTANGRFTDNTPTVGNAPGYVWNDADLNSTSTGPEQTRFNMANANVRAAFVGSLIPPSLKTYTRNGTTATLTVDSYTGAAYQLQRATSLALGNWTNVGNAVAGASGTVLTFTDDDSADPAAFYRVVTVLPTAGRQAASGVSLLRR